jgi:hypothetical protein
METIATVAKADLIHVLTASKRMQTVDGKKVAQVEGCVLSFGEGSVSVLSLTRDLTGLTYVHRECSVFRQAKVPVPDIDRVLAILKMHGEQVSIVVKDAYNIMFKSGNKQTSLQSSLEAKAFGHSPESILAFYEKSLLLSSRISVTQTTYTDRNENRIPAFCSFVAEASEVYDALNSSVSGASERLNRFVFDITSGGTITATVGDPLYGMTETTIETSGCSPPEKDVQMAFDGGLDYLFKHFGGECRVFFFDFTHEEQGYRFGVRFNDGSWAFQAGVL